MVKNQTATQDKTMKQQNKVIKHSNFNVKVNNSLNFKTAIAVGKSFYWRISIHSTDYKFTLSEDFQGFNYLLKRKYNFCLCT